MTLPRILVVVALVLFSTIGIAALVKKNKSKGNRELARAAIEIDISESRANEVRSDGTRSDAARTAESRNNAAKIIKPKVGKPQPVAQTVTPKAPSPLPLKTEAKIVKGEVVLRTDKALPKADRIGELFNKGEPKLPIVETITYRSRVPWQKGRPAWLSDYATHYSTSRHFIARSLNGKPDYFKQNVAEGDRFNVLRPEKHIQFHLVIDTTLCKLWLYAFDLDTQERYLLKDYNVGLGRPEPSMLSGSLTPLGKYELGSRIAIYKPKMMGVHTGQKVEMIRVFGTRWIPFDKEISDTTAPAKGFGLHGVPWKQNEKGELVEDTTSLGKYQSDGCVRLATKDIEEIFAVIITKPAFVELVRNFEDAKLPGKER